ncbi:MurR/RpiR family transcriptional regulator [Microbacterium sp. YY-03]|uniref:MurR/RpiR family transcriptional regulator n=1 Tax=Microbacterium sp. YY-03 TaxID=3421636 RepID=UPI003D185A90
MTTDPGTLARIGASLGSLVPSERRVAALILERPDHITGLSTAELAQAAGTSTATVIRACQSLGFRGFQHLRLEVARATPSQATREDQRATAFDEAISALGTARECVDDDRILAAVDLLSRARRIVLIGGGFSGPPLQDFALRMQTIGYSIEAPVDALAQQFAANALTDVDVALALSYSGANAQTMRAVTAAHERGAHVIVITSYARSFLGRLAHVTISTGPASTPHAVDPAYARLGHTVVLHALHAELARHASHADVTQMRHVVADAIADD